MWPLKGRCLFVMITLGISAALSIAVASTAFATKDYAQELSAGAAPDEAYGRQLDARAVQFARAERIVLLACAAAFLAWFYRASDNLHESGLGGLRYTPGWAIAGFFIPVVCFYKPYLVMQEVWRGSAKLGGGVDERDDVYGPGSFLITIWWITFWGSRILSVCAVQVMLREQASHNLNGIIGALWLSIASAATSVVGAFFAVSLVRRITDMQDRAIQLMVLARERGAASPEPPPVPPMNL